MYVVCRPVITTVRLEASIPAVTCSAVVADPNPLGPGHPVINLIIPIYFQFQSYIILCTKMIYVAQFISIYISSEFWTQILILSGFGLENAVQLCHLLSVKINILFLFLTFVKMTSIFKKMYL